MRASIHFQTGQGLPNPFRATGTSRQKLRKLITALKAILVGGLLLRASSRPKIFAAKAHASGTVAYSSASGAQTVVINGVTVASFSHGASDAADATTAAASITSSTNALIQYLVEACNLAATFTLSGVAVGQFVQIGDFKFTAVNTSTPGADEFYVGGTDTQDAASLVTQILARLGLNENVFASSSSGVVTVRQRRGTTSSYPLVKSGAGITLSGQLAATATVLVSSQRPGPIGNLATLSVTGTGASASAARLTGGTEDVLTF